MKISNQQFVGLKSGVLTLRFLLILSPDSFATVAPEFQSHVHFLDGPFNDNDREIRPSGVNEASDRHKGCSDEPSQCFLYPIAFSPSIPLGEV